MPNLQEKQDKYDKFFMSETDMPEPPFGLEHRIMGRIERYERRVLIAKATGFGALFAASISLVVVGYFNLVSALSQSGFLNFASLFFSDFGAAMANFQDFAFSILESFPVFSVAFVLACVIAAIWSAAHFLSDVSQVRAQRGLAMG